jgi:hypothetical protein
MFSPEFSYFPPRSFLAQPGNGVEGAPRTAWGSNSAKARSARLRGDLVTPTMARTVVVNRKS